MRILITGASGRLAQAIADELGDEHKLRLFDSATVNVEGTCQFMRGSILDPDDTWRAVREIDAVIHTGEPPPDLPIDQLERDQMMLEHATRGTHTLFSAAIAAGVKRFIYAGALEIFDAYPDDVRISEQWKPLPSPDIASMTKYLGELTCREFARDFMVSVICLRLGHLVVEDDVRDKAPNLSWLHVRDAAHAFRCALRQDNSHHVQWASRWDIYHICASFPNPRFLIRRASNIGYAPSHSFPVS